MKIRARIAGYRKLREQALWRLLAADHAPEVIGLLQTLLMEGDRRLPASILHERLQHQLDAINASELSRDLPRTAQAYVAGWLSQGFLERRLPEGASEEEYELAAQATQAIRFITSLEAPRSAATESRLSLVIQQLVQLAMLPTRSLSGERGARTGHPFINGPLGAYMDHMKGPRKQLGKSRRKDLKINRNEPYWRVMR